MRAVFYDGPRSFQVKEVPTPEAAPGEVLVKVKQTGICGTDLHIHEGHFGAKFPLIPGHELVGTVAQVGDGVDSFRLGELVTINPNVSCGHCDYCRRGMTLACPNLKGLGTNYPGSFAEYLAAPYQYVYSVEGLDLDTAVFTEPAACAMHGLESAQIPPGGTVLVFGAGPTGLLLAQLIKNGGASHVTVAASSQFKLDLAKQFGIDDVLLMDRSDLQGSVSELLARSDGGFDVVVEATGDPSIGEVCVSLARNRGTVMLYGVTAPEDQISINPFDVFRREITIKGSFAEINAFSATVAALRTGRARTDGLITHRFALEDFGEALAAFQTDRSVHKVMIDVAD